jgi:hypothetical protein
MKLKSGKDEIIYLLTKVFEKYESETGSLVVRNTNRKNYEGVSKKLSEISNNLPNTAEALDHDIYSADNNPNTLERSLRKYDITVSQVKDAFLGLVNHPRSFLIDACYIYLFSVGRKGFEKNPQDDRLLINIEKASYDLADFDKIEALTLQVALLENEKKATLKNTDGKFKQVKASLIIGFVIVAAALFFSVYQWMSSKNEWLAIKKDMNILPYKPTQSEIDSLEGVWICYTGSPQARKSDPNRYHLVVLNVIDIKYKNGYFTFNRYGANFNHAGYMQYEMPEILSIHSHVKNITDSIESPRHSLMRLDKEKVLIPVISASWSFDVGEKNNIIGIREVYTKQGKGGKIEEIINTIENASCRCKIVKWYQNNDVKTFYLKNVLLDSLPDEKLKALINETSIIVRVPQEDLILKSYKNTIK